MAVDSKLAARDGRATPRISPTAWVGIATAAGTALLLYTGVTTGEWRGVVVSEVQILAVGLACWLVFRD